MEPTNDEIRQKDIASNQLKTKSSNPTKTAPMLVLCGGAAIKALYTNKPNGGKSKK